MFFSKKTEPSKADLLGKQVVSLSCEIAGSISDEMAKKYSTGFRYKLNDPQGKNHLKQYIVEVVVFYVHIIDRIVFKALNGRNRDIFVDEFRIAITRELSQGATICDPEDLIKTLQDTYHRRTPEYYHYKIPQAGEPLKGTLFWEFSKIIFSFFNSENPITGMALHSIILVESEGILSKADEIVNWIQG